MAVLNHYEQNPPRLFRSWFFDVCPAQIVSPRKGLGTPQPPSSPMCVSQWHLMPLCLHFWHLFCDNNFEIRNFILRTVDTHVLLCTSSGPRFLRFWNLLCITYSRSRGINTVDRFSPGTVPAARLPNFICHDPSRVGPPSTRRYPVYFPLVMLTQYAVASAVSTGSHSLSSN